MSSKKKRSRMAVIFVALVILLAAVVAGRFLVPDKEPTPAPETVFPEEQPTPSATESVPAADNEAAPEAAPGMEPTADPPAPLMSVPERVAICHSTNEKTELTLRVGEAVTLTAEAFPDGQNYERPVWSSSDEAALKIAVNDDGSCTCEVIEAISGGAVITAQIAGVAGKCTIYCLP